MDEKLKPCPFCGTTGASVDNDQIECNSWCGSITCNECDAVLSGAYTSPHVSNAEADIIAMWNRRAGVLLPNLTRYRFDEGRASMVGDPNGEWCAFPPVAQPNATEDADLDRNSVIDECITAMGRTPQSNSWQASYQGAARAAMLKLKTVDPSIPNAGKTALLDLHKELGKMKWVGADEGWDKAIEAVRARITEVAR